MEKTFIIGKDEWTNKHFVSGPKELPSIIGYGNIISFVFFDQVSIFGPNTLLTKRRS